LAAPLNRRSQIYGTLEHQIQQSISCTVLKKGGSETKTPASRRQTMRKSRDPKLPASIELTDLLSL